MTDRFEVFTEQDGIRVRWTRPISGEQYDFLSYEEAEELARKLRAALAYD